MVWYNPGTWGRGHGSSSPAPSPTTTSPYSSTPLPSSNSSSAGAVNAGASVTPPKATPVSTPSRSSGGSSQSYKTTSSTGTGYNPATGVNEGTSQPLPSAFVVNKPFTNTPAVNAQANPQSIPAKTGVQNYLNDMSSFSSGLAKTFYPSLYIKSELDKKNTQLVQDFQANPTKYPTTNQTLADGSVEYTLSPDYQKNIQSQYVGDIKKEYSSTASTGQKILGGIGEFSVGGIKGVEMFSKGFSNFDKNILLQTLGGGVIGNSTKKTTFQPFGEQAVQPLTDKTDLKPTFLADVPVYTMSGKIGGFVPATAGLILGGRGIKSSITEYKSMGLTTKEALGQTAITFTEGVSPTRFKYSTVTDAGQIARAKDFISTDLTNAKGIRIINGNKATDIYGKQIKDTTGVDYKSMNVMQSNLIGEKYVRTGGTRQQSLTIPTTSGRVYSFETKEIIGAKGMMLDKYKGYTPSFGNAQNINLITSQSIIGRGNLKVNLFSEGFTPKSSMFGGATTQKITPKGTFVVSRSGEFGGFKTKTRIVGPFESGNFDITKVRSMKFKKSPSTILKIIDVPSSNNIIKTSSNGLNFKMDKPIQPSLQLSTKNILREASTTPLSSTSLLKTPTVISMRTSNFITTAQQPIQTQSSYSASKISTQQLPSLGLEQSPQSATKLWTTPATTSSTATSQITIPRMTTQTKTALGFAPAVTTTFGTPNIFKTRTEIFPPFSIPNMGGGLSSGGKRKKLKGKQKFKYTPSYEALVKNITGKAPKGLETGARIRPIPKGFSFANKTPKFKLKW